jgi:3-oxoacyl-[acyl-carrier protein] reductase
MLSENGAAKVVIFDFDEEKGQAVAKSLCNGLFCKVDVSSEDSVKSGFEMVRATCGRLDIMVNCAGIVGPNAVKTADVETAKFDRVYEGTRP